MHRGAGRRRWTSTGPVAGIHERRFRRYLERPRRRRLARVVEAYYRHVRDTAFRITGNAADAADQDVFLELLLDPPPPEPVWVAEGRETVAPAVVLVPDCPVRVRLELDDGLRLRGEPSFSAGDTRGGAPLLVHAARQGEALVWTLSGLPAGTFTIEVSSAPGYARARGEVITAAGAEAELRLRLVPR